MKKVFWLFLFSLIIVQILVAQEEERASIKPHTFENYYLSPLKVSRDHPLHASIFQLPLLSARSLANDTGVMGGSFEYTSIESDYKEGDFSYNFERGVYRLNFNLDVSIRDDLDVMVLYDYSGIDGEKITAMNPANILNTSLKKSGSGNIDVLARQRIYTFDDYGIDFGLAIGGSIPIVKTKTLAASKKFDFGGAMLFTLQREDYAIHFNLGFVYLKKSTAFSSAVDFNISVYGGASVVGHIMNNLYGVVQITAQNPAIKNDSAPENIVFDGSLGVRYIYESYVTEVWIGHGLGEASHGVNGGVSVSLCF